MNGRLSDILRLHEQPLGYASPQSQYPCGSPGRSKGRVRPPPPLPARARRPHPAIAVFDAEREAHGAIDYARFGIDGVGNANSCGAIPLRFIVPCGALRIAPYAVPSLGVSLQRAIQHGVSSKSYWHMARTPAVQQGMTNAWLKAQGLVSVQDLWCKAQAYAR